MSSVERARIFVALVACGFVGMGQAEEGLTSLENLTVTEVSVAAPAAHVHQLEAADLAALPAGRIDDKLRSVPAFSLFRRSSSRVANPTTQGVTLRGIAPSGTSRSLVLWDGMPLNDPFGGWVYWNRVPLANMSTVRVASGGLSSAWGSAALAGLITMNSRAEPETQIWAGGGNLGQREAGLVGGLDIGSSRWEGGAQFSESDGYFQLPPEQRGSIDVPANDSVRLGWAGWTGEAGAATIAVRGGYFREERSNGTRLTGNETDLSWVQARAAWTTGEHHWRWQAYAQDQELASTFSSQAADRNSETPALDQFAVPATAFGSSWEWEYGPWNAGLDVRHVDGETNERYFFRDGDFVNQRQAGASQLFAGYWHQYRLERDGWQLQLSGRVDWWKIRDGFLRQQNRSTGEVTTDNAYPDRDDWEFSPRLDLTRKLDAQNTLRMAAWRSFRVPTINELVRPFRVRSDITAANPDLETEYLTGVDLGWNYRSETLQSQLTLFWNQLDDAVANITLTTDSGPHPVCGFVPNGGSCRQRQNLEQIIAQGVEWDMRWSPVATWSFQLGMMLADNTVEEGPMALRGRDVAQVPDFRGTVGVTHRGWVQTDLRLQRVGAQFEDDQNQRALESYTTLDLRLSRSIIPGLVASLSAENLTDEEFLVGQTGEGLTTLGMPRLVMFSLRYTLAGG